MNCKLGDLAIIVSPVWAGALDNLGKIVEVLGADPFGRTGFWLVQTSGAPSKTTCGRLTHIGIVEDSRLRPIPRDSQEDESQVSRDLEVPA